MGFLTILSGVSTLSQDGYGLGNGLTLASSYLWWLAVILSAAIALLVPSMSVLPLRP